MTPSAPPGGHTDDPEVVRLAHDLRMACMRIARRVRFDSGESERLTPHQFSVLARLDCGPRTVSELAGIERVSAPSMSRTVTGLVEAGMVLRTGDESDGRVVHLSLSPDGKAELEAGRAGRDAWMAERIEGLTGREREMLRRATEILERVVDQ